MDINKENTLRVLKGQEPIQNIRCRLGWHRWTSWSYIERQSDFMPGVATCYCADCGMPRIEPPYSKKK
jgi:hypothetical protein